MVITTVEGIVPADREVDLLRAWDRVIGEAIPPGLTESTLARAADGRWRIHTVWESPEALAAMRASADRPAAIAMFEAAGAAAEVSVWDVVAHLRPDPASGVR